MYMYYLLEKKLKYVSEDRMEGQTVTTVMILSFRTDRSGQTVQTQIRAADQRLDFAIPSASFERITLW